MKLHSSLKSLPGVHCLSVIPWGFRNKPKVTLGGRGEKRNKPARRKANLQATASLSTSGSSRKAEMTLQKVSEEYAFFGQ